MQHAAQAAGEWKNLTLFAKLGNIGSEVERTIKWKEKGNEQLWKNAFYRSLELFSLTINTDLTSSQLQELCRAREIWIDYAYYDNKYKSTAALWRSYFNHFVIAHRNSEKIKS